MQIIKFIIKEIRLETTVVQPLQVKSLGTSSDDHSSGGELKPQDIKRRCASPEYRRNVPVCSFLGSDLSCLTTRVVWVDSKGRIGFAGCSSTHVSVSKVEAAAAREKSTRSTNSTSTQSASCFGFRMGYGVFALSLELLKVHGNGDYGSHDILGSSKSIKLTGCSPEEALPRLRLRV
jgi:hypothetical protein